MKSSTNFMNKAALFTLMTVLAIGANGQETVLAPKSAVKDKNGISLGYGYITRENALNGLILNSNKLYYVNDSNKYNLQKAIAWKIFGTDRPVSYGPLEMSGALTIAYRRQLTSWLWAGVSAAYERNARGLLIDMKKEGTLVRSAYTIAPELQVTYKHKGMITWYGDLALGNTFVHVKYSSLTGNETVTDNFSYFAFQITPVAIKVGKKLSGFAEAGFGYKGTLHVGAAYNF